MYHGVPAAGRERDPGLHRPGDLLFGSNPIGLVTTACKLPVPCFHSGDELDIVRIEEAPRLLETCAPCSTNAEVSSRKPAPLRDDELLISY